MDPHVGWIRIRGVSTLSKSAGCGPDVLGPQPQGPLVGGVAHHGCILENPRYCSPIGFGLFSYLPGSRTGRCSLYKSHVFQSQIGHVWVWFSTTEESLHPFGECPGDGARHGGTGRGVLIPSSSSGEV